MEIHLRPGETAVVGYGSLLSRTSAERTLGRSYDGPFVYCHVDGWRRGWDIGMPNAAFYCVDSGGARVYPSRILYLNVRPEPDSAINVVVFVVTADELDAMHRREWIYEPVIVTGALRGVQVSGGDAVMYVAKPEYVVRGAGAPSVAAVRASYLRILDDGFRIAGDAFRAEFERTSDPPPDGLVVEDHLDPDGPPPWQRSATARAAFPPG